MAPRVATRPRRKPASRAQPVRTCVGCRRSASPDELIRLAWGTGPEVQIGRNVPGRGAWLCEGRVECFDLAVQRRAIARALRIELSEQEISQLRARLHGAAPEEGATGRQSAARWS